VNVTKAAGANVTVPTATVSGGTLTVNAVSLMTATGQSIEYAIGTSQSSPGTWQSSNTFTLTPGTNYYVFARSASNTNYNAGMHSVSTSTYKFTEKLTVLDENGVRIAGSSTNDTNPTLIVPRNKGYIDFQLLVDGQPYTNYANLVWGSTWTNVANFVHSGNQSNRLTIYPSGGTGDSTHLTIYITGQYPESQVCFYVVRQ